MPDSLQTPDLDSIARRFSGLVESVQAEVIREANAKTAAAADGLRRETVTLASVKACNAWVDWMEKATAGLAEEDLVDVVRRDTPFGTFLLAIRPHAA